MNEVRKFVDEQETSRPVRQSYKICRSWTRYSFTLNEGVKFLCWPKGDALIKKYTRHKVGDTEIIECISTARANKVSVLI